MSLERSVYNAEKRSWAGGFLLEDREVMVIEKANDRRAVLARKKPSLLMKPLVNCVTKILNIPNYLAGPKFPDTTQNTIIIRFLPTFFFFLNHCF